jgi:hypothetical protein
MKQSKETCFPIAELLSQAGIVAVIHAVTPSNIGGNNRIYRVETSQGIFSAKQYFRHVDDQRDRLSAEYDFLQYAGKATPGFVPQSYACSREAGWALYEHIEGAHICAGQVEWRHVKQAVEFFQALNKSISRKAAQGLPLASEAIFSVADHLAIVAGRIDCLHEALSNANGSDQAAIEFLEQLQHFWTLLAGQTEAVAAESGWLNKSLDEEQYCISPSDFGFHNALVKANGDIQFIDFEYAGFDDPAKMAGDFFAQLVAPVPVEFYDRFVQLTMQSFPDPNHLIWRAKLLQPVYQVKWCCIAMNVFLPVHMERRKFANVQLDETGLKQTQLNKAKQILKKLK